MTRRPAVRSATVDLVSRGGVLRPQADGPTPERAAKGDLHRVLRVDEGGRQTYVTRAVTPILVEQLQAAGEVGGNIPALLTAAAWFIEQGELAQLRGRQVRSQLGAQAPSWMPSAADRQVARGNLAHAYDWLGSDGFNALYDTLIWEIEPRGADRRALFRAALHALARTLNAKKPPGQ